jgi:hypothetical protein
MTSLFKREMLSLQIVYLGIVEYKEVCGEFPETISELREPKYCEVRPLLTDSQFNSLSSLGINIFQGREWPLISADGKDGTTATFDDHVRILNDYKEPGSYAWPNTILLALLLSVLWEIGNRLWKFLSTRKTG